MNLLAKLSTRASIGVGTPAATSRAAPPSWAASRFLFIITCLLIFLPSRFVRTNLAQDVDDYLRGHQITDLLADRQWHDLVLPNIQSPEPYLSPWSRLVDAPYVWMTDVLGLFMTQSDAYYWAKFIVPPLFFIVFAVLLFAALRRMTTRAPALYTCAAAPLLCVVGLNQFLPGRIDHHNLQFVAMMLMTASILSSRRQSGLLTGLAIILSIAIGLETLPFIGAALGTLTISAVLGQSQAREHLIYTGAALFGLTLPIALILMGASEAASPHCDALTAPWISGMMLGGAAFMSLALWPRAEAQIAAWLGTHLGKRINTRSKLFPIATRCGLFALPTAATLAIVAGQYPQCLAGPYHMIDPVSKAFWLDNVVQENGMVWLSGQMTAFFEVMTYLLLWPFLAIAVFKVYVTARALPAGLMTLLVLAALSLLLPLWQSRFMYFSFIFMLPVIFWVVDEIEVTLPLLWRNFARPLTGFAAAFVIIFTGFLIMPKNMMVPNTAKDVMDINMCKGEDFAGAQALPKGRILAPLGLSMELINHIEPANAVAAIPFHRASPGIRKVAEFFTSPDSAVRSRAAGDYAYLAICRGDNGADLSVMPVYDALMHGRPWPGLTEIPDAGSGNLVIYAIDHGALR